MPVHQTPVYQTSVDQTTIRQTGVATFQELAERCRAMAARTKSPRTRTQLMLLATDYESKVSDPERERGAATVARRLEAERQKDYRERRE